LNAKLSAAVILSICALAGSFTVGGLAQAAADLARAIPTPGSQLAEAPDSVELQFTQELDDGSLALNGEELDAEIENDTISAELPELDEGEHEVAWSVTSVVDGRETSGTYVFTVEVDEDESPPEVNPEERAERVNEVGDDNRTAVLLWTAFGIGLGVLLLIVFFFFRSTIPGLPPGGLAGGLPPPGQSPPEHHEEESNGEPH
jgi:methionine-rich copper-binding protein CopC